MNTQTLIDQVITDIDHTDSSDADNTNRRAQILRNAQRAYSEFWNSRDWPWSYGSSTLTVSANGTSTTCPADFQEVGYLGGVIQTTNIAHGKELTEVSPAVVQRLQASSQTYSIHEVFAIFGTNDTIATQLFQVAKCSGSTDFDMDYKKIPPTLVDAGDTTSNLQQVPAGYHESVLYPATAYRSALDKGYSELAQVFLSMFTRGMEQVNKMEAQIRSAKRRLGRTVPYKW